MRAPRPRGGRLEKGGKQLSQEKGSEMAAVSEDSRQEGSCLRRRVKSRHKAQESLCWIQMVCTMPTPYIRDFPWEPMMQDSLSSPWPEGRPARAYNLAINDCQSNRPDTSDGQGMASLLLFCLPNVGCKLILELWGFNLQWGPALVFNMCSLK